MRGDGRGAARQSQPDRLDEAVHRVRGEHARAGTAGRAGRLFDQRKIGVGDARIDRVRHGRDEGQVRADCAVTECDLAAFHRTAGHEHGGDVEPQRGHQHAGSDLVAGRDADHGVRAMGVDHVLDRVGHQVARGQRVEHSAVAHGDAVVDSDGIELARNGARGPDRVGDHPAHHVELGVAGHELREAVDDGDDGLADVLPLNAGGAEQGSGAHHVSALSDGARS